ncbi:uncharacterized protein LOC114326161 [Diabrotica virgifera virgifera]|uniref:Uncharacterized protein LOC114326161 n=1 Tax=Diabrotica virgifera virgifera TaxID=50390 RepID=A0A6P7F3G8_DIAVI|nr:uncharacterized protein LOC114326161 [Diabrotica virgifera virgifera]
MTDQQVIKIESDDENDNANENNGTNDEVVMTVQYTNEQRIVSAVWMHEKRFNKQSLEDIRKNFQIRFKIPAPNTKTLEQWEEQLFSKGKIVTDEKGEVIGDNENSIDQLSDENSSDEDVSD